VGTRAACPSRAGGPCDWSASRRAASGVHSGRGEPRISWPAPCPPGKMEWAKEHRAMNETLQRELSWLEKTHQLSSQSKLSSESFPIISLGTILFFLVPALPFLPLIILSS
jgi:hypothetical protein